MIRDAVMAWGRDLGGLVEGVGVDGVCVACFRVTGSDGAIAFFCLRTAVPTDTHDIRRTNRADQEIYRQYHRFCRFLEINFVA
jgi:hypothetical protein